MPLFIALGVMLTVGIFVRFVGPAWSRHRIAAELRRDWWPQFEADLRAYARGKSAREAEQRW